MAKKKLNISDKEKAIVNLLGRIENEGVHYAFTEYGMNEYLKALNDKTLNKLAKEFIKSSKKLEKHLDKLRDKVEPIMEELDADPFAEFDLE